MKRAAASPANGGGVNPPPGTKRRRSSRPAFFQQTIPIVRGSSGDKPLVLLRLPEEVQLAPANVESYLYAEEISIEDDDGPQPQQNPQQQPPKRQRRMRPSFQWVLESEQPDAARLTGVRTRLGGESIEAAQYFIVTVAEADADADAGVGAAAAAAASASSSSGGKKGGKQCQIEPLEDAIVLRHAHAAGSGSAERVYMDHGQRIRTWRDRYGTAGKALMAALQGDGEGEGDDGGGRKPGQQQERRWVRTHRVDEDADAGEDRCVRDEEGGKGEVCLSESDARQGSAPNPPIHQ